VEEYIERCITSLQQQDIPKSEYEIIIINDGSPDNSKDVILRLIQQYENIVFIDQENQGVSRARNAGIDKAQGEYLLFIDPDDYVEINALAQVLTYADQYRAEVCFLGYTFLGVDGEVREKIFYTAFTNAIYTGAQAYVNSRRQKQIDPDKSVAILYNREFVNRNSIRYIADVPYLEDGEIIARILCMAERCVFNGKGFYQRTTRIGSATNSNLFYTDKATHGFIRAASNLKKFSTNTVLNIEQKLFLNQPIAKFTFLAVRSSIYKMNFEKIRNVKKMLCKEGLKKLELEGVLSDYRLPVKLYNISYAVFLIHLFCTNVFTSINSKLNTK
jgi:glycosyltransferase involved in cell wall biosynthesis